MQPEPSALAGSAGWHLYDVSSGSGDAALVRLDESDFRQASFLDQRILPLASQHTRLPLSDFAAALAHNAAPSQEPHFIFHIGHCGSTLLSRALDASPHCLPVREPLTLRRIATNDADSPPSLLETVLLAHQRVFRAGQRPIIKATSTCNALIGPILQQRAGSRAVLMYVELETYLCGMLGKKSPATDLSGHLPARLADWRAMQGAPPLEPDSLDESRQAALAWLTGMRHLASAAKNCAPQVRLLDFERFLAEAESQLERTAAWLGLEADLAVIRAAWPDVSTGYSKKPDEPYSAFNRRRTLQRGRVERRAEVHAGLRWAELMLDTLPDLSPCRPYLGG